MSGEPAFRNYDAWLEKPYEDQAKAQEAFEAYWEQYGADMTQAIKDNILRDAPSGDLGYLKGQLHPVIEDMSEEVLARWANNIDTVKFPTFEDWLDAETDGA